MNITDRYNEVVAELYDRARLEKSDGLDDEDAVSQAIDDGFLYDEDREIVLAYAFETGVIEWGRAVDWDAIDSMLWNDIREELKKGA